jgi:hypothetical protein
MRTGHRLLVAALCLLVSACAGTTPTRPAGSGAAPAGSAVPPAGSFGPLDPAPGLFTDPVDPLNLTVAADRTRSVTATVSTAGGSLTATGADGTTFALEIPKDALAGAIDITLTPITDLQGWSVAPGNAAAVLMEPEGLKFVIPGHLVITPTQPIGDAQGIPFRFYAEGTDAHLILPEPDPTRIVIPVEHFSGHGFSWNISVPFAVAMARYRQTQAEDRLVNRLAAELASRRAQELQGQTPSQSLGDWVESIISEWERDILNKRLLLASKSCKDGQYALNGFIAFNRQMQLLAIARQIDPPPRLPNLVRYVCAEEWTELCFDNGDVEWLAANLLSDARQLALVGKSTGGDTAAYLEACDRFELRIEEHSEQNLADYELMSADLSITIPLRFVPNAGDELGLTGETVGEAKAEFKSGEGTVAGCDLTLAGAEADVPFKAKLERVEYINTGPERTSIRLKDVKLQFYSGHLNVKVSVKCPAGSSPYGEQDIPFYFARYKSANEGAVTISGWKVEDHPEMATKTFNRESPAGRGKGKESLELTLVHTPGPMPPRPDIPVD